MIEEYKLGELARQEMEISFLQEAVLYLKDPSLVPNFDNKWLVDYFIKHGYKSDLVNTLFGMKQLEMLEDDFDNKFHLITNHLNPTGAFDGYMFETYGEELDYIIEMNSKPETKNKIWTILEDDNDSMYYVSGFHTVNRIGYLLTEENVEKDIEITVICE